MYFSPQLYAKKKDKSNEENKNFENISKKIKQIVSKAHHPKTNGKLKIWFDLYENHGREFNTFGKFVDLYNKREYHEHLDTKNFS